MDGIAYSSDSILRQRMDLTGGEIALREFK